MRIEPFKALRPRAEVAARVASVPYDVVTADEARALAAGEPLSFLHVVRSEIDLEPGADPYADRVYAKAAANLGALERDGVLVRDSAPSIFLYRLAVGGRAQTGIACGVSAAEYEAGLIKRHEHTRREKEDDRVRHIAACRAHAEPVFLMYRAVPAVDRAVESIARGAPLYDFTASDGVRHSLWSVSDAAVLASLADLFASVPALYIADGHHRAAAAARCAASCGGGRAGLFPAVLFPHDHLTILGYHRVVKGLNGLSPAALLSAAGRAFTVEATVAPPRVAAGVVGMFLDGGWHLLHPRQGAFDSRDPVASLDASVLQESLLGPVLGIADPRTDARIDFIGGTGGSAVLERLCRGGADVAFCLAPVTVDQVMAVSDAARIMPPKSTWFEPKLRSGLFVHPF